MLPLSSNSSINLTEKSEDELSLLPSTLFVHLTLNNDHAYDLPQAYFPPDFIGLTPCIVRAHLLLLIHLHLFYQVFANKSFQSLFSSKKKKKRIRNVSDTHIIPCAWVRYAVDPVYPTYRSCFKEFPR